MIHIQLIQELRVSTPEKPRELALVHAGQLHTMGERIDSMDNISYAAEWDMRSPWVTVLKGSLADIKLAYAGWPMVEEAEYKLLHPVEELV